LEAATGENIFEGRRHRPEAAPGPGDLIPAGRARGEASTFRAEWTEAGDLLGHGNNKPGKAGKSRVGLRCLPAAFVIGSPPSAGAGGRGLRVQAAPEAAAQSPDGRAWRVAPRGIRGGRRWRRGRTGPAPKQSKSPLQLRTAARACPHGEGGLPERNVLPGRSYPPNRGAA